jgi:hypothetical protein
MWFHKFLSSTTGFALDYDLVLGGEFGLKHRFTY